MIHFNNDECVIKIGVFFRIHLTTWHDVHIELFA